MADDGAGSRRIAGRYRLEDLIGRGGAGAVWRGLDEQLRRPVAVKQIAFPGDEQAASTGRERALREARAAARLRDPGVVGVYDILEEDGSAFLIMELVDAPNLKGLVRRDGPLTPRATARLGLRILNALAAAHRAGVVHRDVKPSNVLVDGDRPKLTDFGIARLGDDATLTTTGVVLGTPAYIAPEHARGDDVGPPADLYGLGATLFFAVEGVAPFGERGAWSTVMAVLNGAHRPLRRAGPLAPLLTDLLARDPAERPAVTEVRRRLREVATGPEPTPVGPPLAGDHVADDTDEIAPRDLEGTGEVGRDDADGTGDDAPGDRGAGQVADGPPERASEGAHGGDPRGEDATDRDAPAAVGTTPAEGDHAGADRAAGDGAGAPPSGGEPPEHAPPAAAAAAGATGTAGGAARPLTPAASPDHPARDRPTPHGPSDGGTPSDDDLPGDGGPRRRTAVLASAIAVLLVLGLTWAAGGDDPSDDAGGDPTPGAGAIAGGTPSAAASTPAAPSSAPTPPSEPSTPEPSTTPSRSPSGDGVLPAYQDAEVPDDWTAYRPGEAPYRLRHPPDWQVASNSARQTDLRDPQTGTYLRLEWTDQGLDPVPDRRRASDGFAERVDGYRNLGITATTYRGEPAALWEYRFRDGGADLHAYSLVVNDGQTGWGLNLVARQSNWPQARELWPGLLSSYRLEGGG